MILSGISITGGVSAQQYDIVPTDPFYSNVSLLLHGDGTEGSTTFLDNSPSPKTPTVVGAMSVDTAIKQFGTGSIKSATPFTGRLEYADNADFNFGSGNFTIEFFVRVTTNVVEQTLITKGWQDSPGFAAFLVYVNGATGRIRFGASSDGASWNIANERNITPSAVAINTWHHVAVTRSGTTFRSFFNGAQTDTWTSSLALLNSSTQELCVGGRIVGSNSMRGNLDEVRLTKGVARYTAAFTVPTEAFPNS